MKLLKIALLLLSFSFIYSSQSQDFNYEKAWDYTAKLRDKNLPSQAYISADSIFQQAKKEQTSIQIVKSLIYKSNFRSTYEEEATLKTINEIKKELKSAEGAEKAMLQVALSDVYIQYYHSHQWEIRNRNNIAGKTPENIIEWSQYHFKNEIETLLQGALSHKVALQKESAAYWKEVFKLDVWEFKLQPFLYDFVAWKAIEFYSSHDFTNDTQEDLVLLNNPLYFTDYQTFGTLELNDIAPSYKKNTLLLFQSLIHFHRGNKNVQPLLLEEIERLKYLNEKGIIDDKEDLIYTSLEQLLKQYKKIEGGQLIAKSLVSLYTQNNATDEQKLERANDICLEMLQLPNPISYFKNMQKQLHQKELRLYINDAILPYQINTAKLEFTNIDEVWFRIVAIDKGNDIEKHNYRRPHFEKYVSLPAQKEFSLKVSPKTRLIEKSAAFEIPELDFGRYALIVSNDADFDVEKSHISMHSFWVTNLNLIEQTQDGEYLVLDRETGKPMKGTEINIFSSQWEYSSRSNVKKHLESITTDKNGFFNLTSTKNVNSISIALKKGQDEWRVNTYSRKYRRNNKSYEKHHFFTDRAIYRPGQTVYFKSIFTEQKGNKVKPIANSISTIHFYSANGKKLQSIDLQSNEFGSVSGSFICPLSGLNGRMRISDSKGSISFLMEEYKRPKFEVKLDKPKEEYSINENVKLTGNASYYAGVAVQNAKVKFKVVRSNYMPWRWTYYPIYSSEIPISAGEIQTNENGDFEITFKAIAPLKQNEVNYYNYSVIAEVTDATGETHTQNTHVKIGSHSLLISADLPPIMDSQNAKDVLIKAQTPNGKTLQKEIVFKLEKLKTPDHIIKEQPWDVDTNFTTIPIESSEISDLSIEATVLIKTLNTKNDSIIPKSIFQALSNGAYKMTLTATEKNGLKVEQTAFVKILSSQNNEMPLKAASFFFMDKTIAQVDEQIKFSLGTSYKKQDYYYLMTSGNKIIESGWQKINDEIKHINIKILEEYRGGISLQVFFQRDNVFHSYSKNIHIPFDNKKLDVQLVTMRNPMQPGQKEHWKLQVKGAKGDHLAAEIMTGMYDASLDVFAENNWSLWPYQPKRNQIYWRSLKNPNSHYKNYDHQYFQNNIDYNKLALNWDTYHQYGRPLIQHDKTTSGMTVTREGMSRESLQPNAVAAAVGGVFSNDDEDVPNDTNETAEPKKDKAQITPRKNLNETAFFYPQLTTDSEGNIALDFTSPEALSRWKLMVLATTKDMEIGTLTQEFITQKELMIIPNLPRFLRGGDKITLSAKLMNLMENHQHITAELQILDAKTMQPIHILSENESAEKSFEVEAKGQAAINWIIDVPEKVGAVVIRVLAKGKEHSDGEEHMLPVLSQMQFLTDTYPFTLKEEVFVTAKSLGLKPQNYKNEDEVTLEITTNPIWYVVQALPNYIQPQKPTAAKWFNYYFVNAMAADIVEKNPQIENVFKQWQLQNPEELKSELNQNPELKQILLQETPWVRNAESQSNRKQEIARLFDKNNLEHHLQMAINKLRDLQKSNGGFAWYSGMKTSPYITAQITEGMGQLFHKNILNFKKDHTAKNISRKAIQYLDNELVYRHKEALKPINERRYYSSARKLLMARSYFLNEFEPKTEALEAYEYFLAEWDKDWKGLGLKSQIDLAKLLLLSKKSQNAEKILLSLKDKALTDEFGGIYWRDLMKYSAPENQAAMIELFELAGEEQAYINGLKLWLLQQKRSNDWGSGIATAKACYAMLSGSSSLNNAAEVFLTINGETTQIDGNAGTGYYKVTWRGKEIAQKLEELKISKKGDALVFGALYNQHFEKMSQIEAHDGGVEIEKKVFVAKTTEGKNELFELSESTPILLGDRILVRLTFHNTQSMDFVHLRDYLPAGFENTNPLSGYSWQGNMGYYQSPSDIATDYFIYHLPKGEFVIEYELNATSAGRLNLGPAEIQSLYAPEFGGHSEGGTVLVE